MKKLLALFMLILLFQELRAQRAGKSNIDDGKIEVIAYSSAQLIPNDVYVSFVLKDYFENG